MCQNSAKNVPKYVKNSAKISAKSYYTFHHGIDFPKFESVKTKGNKHCFIALCPFCKKPMKIIHHRKQTKFFQCDKIHLHKRFVYMI